jgi:hypothetical protein
MSKVGKGKAGSVRKSRNYFGLHPWQCRHHADRSEIVAYVEASGAWETVAVIPATSGAHAEELATFIASLVNDNQQNQTLLQAAIHALELVIEDDGLTFSSEQAVDSVIERLKKRNCSNT